jgi:hypothetical protein
LGLITNSAAAIKHAPCWYCLWNCFLVAAIAAIAAAKFGVAIVLELALPLNLTHPAWEEAICASQKMDKIVFRSPNRNPACIHEVLPLESTRFPFHTSSRATIAAGFQPVLE